MSDFHIIGENRLISPVTGADVVRSVVVDGTIYAYWREAAEVGLYESRIMVSTSTDTKTWTTPVVALSGVPSYDYRLGGVAHDGTKFVMVYAELGTPGGLGTNFYATSTTGITFGGVTPIDFGEYWACVSDLVWTGTTWYLAATAQLSFGAQYIATVKTSTNLSSWTSLGYANALTATSTVHPRIEVINGVVHLVMREGAVYSFSQDDRILYTTYDGQWRATEVVTKGTGDPDIVSIADGLAIIYQNQELHAEVGIWSWLLFDGAEFVTRGAFSQGFTPGAGGAVFSYGDDFAVVYGQRPDPLVAPGTLYFRDFNTVADEPASVYAPRYTEPKPPSQKLENFDVSISAGSIWYSLSDGIRFYMSPEDFGDKAQVLRRVTAVSPFYDGTYLIHSTRENVQEGLTIGILGTSQNHVTENMLLLEELVSQPSYRIRLTMGDHAETWSCQSADYTIQRGHINMHNTRAMMKLMVPRLPAVSYEVV